MKRLTSFGHPSETQSPIKTQRPAGKTKKQMWKTWKKEEVRLISQWRANEGKLCALVSSELTGNKSTSISVIVSPVISMQNTKHKNTQIIPALAFSTTWTDKLQNKKQKKTREWGSGEPCFRPEQRGWYDERQREGDGGGERKSVLEVEGRQTWCF